MGRKDPPDGWQLPGYEHRRLLGSGAGGRVWLAVHHGTGTPVAVKYLSPRLHAAAEFREAYRSEAVLLAALDSPHVTRLYEYVEGPAGAAIVMEAVEGASLRELLRREGAAASPEAALSILKGSLLGLAAAHSAGVVHRDYKPANVLVTPEGASKLVDFGIAARSGAPVEAVGTPLYMAPEQFLGAPASPAGDVYSATVAFFECVTGERPFPGTTAVQLMAQHALGRVPDELAPEPVRELIRWGMAKSPQDRPGDASLLLAELESAAGAAYGERWEERGRRELAAVTTALLPLLVLAELSGSSTVGATSYATTVLGTGAGGVVGGGVDGGSRGEGLGGGPREDHRERRTRRTAVRRTVGAGVGALVLIGAAVAVAAAYDPRIGGGAKGGADTGDAALTGATTLVSTGAGAFPPPPPHTASNTPSPSPSLTPTTAAAQSSVPAAASTSSNPATDSSSPAASPTAPASVDEVDVTSVYCVGGKPTLDANVTVTSNGGGGSVTFNWFYETAGGSQESVGSPVTVTLTAGESQQSVSPPAGADFADYTDYPRWGVSVTSTPEAASDNSPQTLVPDQSGCGVG
jgi:serine/threonine-protein kinase